MAMTALTETVPARGEFMLKLGTALLITLAATLVIVAAQVYLSPPPVPEESSMDFWQLTAMPAGEITEKGSAANARVTIRTFVPGPTDPSLRAFGRFNRRA